MDEQTRLAGLDHFLASIYGEGTNLDSMLEELGFEAEQGRVLREDCVHDVAGEFIEAVRRKLNSGEKDMWFRLLSRRFGLDGDPAVSLDEAARALNIDFGAARQAETDALQKCRTKTMLTDLQRELHKIALVLLKQSAAKPGKDQVVAKLTRLADLHAAVDITRMDYESKRAEVLKKVQAELDALETEYQPLLDAAQDNASALEAEIKNDVLLRGQSVSTDVYQAVYVKGRISWDTEGINHYAVVHPDVLQYRKEGQPSVTLRGAGKKQ